jgi:hypothetical protein
VINLNNVTLLGIDCVSFDKLIIAANISESFIRFNKTVLLTSLDNSDSRAIKIPDISTKEDYDKFVMEKLNEYVDTEYVLIIQHDGHILNPNAWDDRYLNYDYIGSPWGHGDLSGKVGNGGFSLRSKKLLEECANATFPRVYGGIENQEDVQICHSHRDYFKSKGIKFAPKELAEKFSIEGNEHNDRTWTYQFGFHDLHQTNTSNFIIPNDKYKFNIFYKYSDRGKQPDLDKKTIFQNFVNFFGVQNMSIMLDNSSKESYDFFAGYCPGKIWETQLGNATASIYLFEKAKELDDHEIIYFCEDDYLHASAHSKPLIFEGLDIADYVTLYDHGDKYDVLGYDPKSGPPAYNQNPHVSEGGELTRVLLTRNSHWKHTNSTTMTFAAKAKTIKEDYKILEKYCNASKLSDNIPDDFKMWQALIKTGRKLISSIPGRSTHMCPNGFYSPLIRWDMITKQ